MTRPSLGALLCDRARRDPDRELLRFEGASWTVGRLDEASCRLARVLRGRGIVRGERVAVMMPNGLDFPTWRFALAKMGAVMVAINPQYREADLAHVLADSGARLALAGSQDAGQVAAARPAWRRLRCWARARSRGWCRCGTSSTRHPPTSPPGPSAPTTS